LHIFIALLSCYDLSTEADMLQTCRLKHDAVFRARGFYMQELAHISYGNSVCPSVHHVPVLFQDQVR